MVTIVKTIGEIYQEMDDFFPLLSLTEVATILTPFSVIWDSW